MKLCYLDCETTGAKARDKSVYGLIQIGGIIEIDGRVAKEFDLRIKPFPNDVIEPEALQVNGETKESIFAPDRRDPRVAYVELQKIFGAHVGKFDRSDKFHFIAYNAPFDSEMLRIFFEKNDDTYFGSWFSWPSIDVAGLAGFFLMADRWKLKDFKLMTVAQFLGIKIDDGEAHDAMHDIRVTRRLFQKISAGFGRTVEI